VELICSQPAGQVLSDQGRLVLIGGQFQAVLVAYGLAASGTLLIAAWLRDFGLLFRVLAAAENPGGAEHEPGQVADPERIGSHWFSPVS